MAGAIGTALMLLECSQVGARIDLDAIPRPDGVPLLRWLSSFPSFGFILSVRPDKLSAVLTRFAARDIACRVIGDVDDSRTLTLRQGDVSELLWDLNRDAFIREAADAQALHA
jgi:selenophosphate synthetase-related protein